MSRLVRILLSLFAVLLFWLVLAPGADAACDGTNGDGCSAGNYCIGDYATINTYSCTTPPDPDDHCIEAPSGHEYPPCTGGTCGSWESYSIHGCTTWEIPADGSCDDDTSWRGGSCCSECDVDPPPPPEPDCEDTSPDQPVLSSPASGSTIDDKKTTLVWNSISDWGENCDDNTNTYQVCASKTSGGCDYGVTYAEVDNPGQWEFTGDSNAWYYWYVRTSNGAEYTDSSIWNFYLTVRPALCNSTAVEFLSGTGGKNSAVVTSSAVSDTITGFSLTFYNLDNLVGGNPLAYCVAGGSSSSCPAGSHQYTTGYTVPGGGTAQSHDFTINFDDLAGADINFSSLVPQKLQMNAFFLDNLGRVSLPDGDCVEKTSKVEGWVYLYDGISACNSAVDLNYQSVASTCGGSVSTVTNNSGSDFHLLACETSTTLSVAVNNPDYGCSSLCNVDLPCVFRTVWTGDSVSQDFYFQLIKPAWWQAVGGNIHADGGNVSSSIPSTATLPYLITGTSGLASYTGGWDTGEGTINESGDEWRAQTVYRGFETDYGYFANILADDPQPWEVWYGSQPGADGVYAAAGDMATSEIFDIIDKKIVILVNGNVSIDYDISVAEGGFLAIISSGDITIADSVTNVEGVYVADGTIVSGAGTDQLIGEGIFVGWTDIDLGRDLGIGNDDDPAEKFIYRPDLVRNAYRYLKKPKIGWVEVAP